MKTLTENLRKIKQERDFYLIIPISGEPVF